MLKPLPIALSCASLLCAAPAAAQLSIMTLGDSITQGGKPNHLTVGLASYREPLINLLNSNGYAGQFQMVGSMSQTLNDNPGASVFSGQPNHEGHYGWAADEILNGIGDASGKLSTWLSGYTPDIVLLHIGTNDAIWQPEPNLADFATNTWGEISNIISTIQIDNPLVHIFVAQIIPVRSSLANLEIQERINALNAQIGLNATNLGATIVDFQGLAPDSTMLADSFHPNVAGEFYMAERWFNAMEQSGALSAIPEPSTYALIAGVSTLLCVAFRRRRALVSPKV